MKILLINPPIRTWAPPNCFPSGLGMIASVLRKDHDVEILDLNIMRHPKDYTKILGSGLSNWIERTKGDFDAVGITGLITNYRYVKDLIQSVKQWLPEVPIIVGGALGSSVPEMMLKKAGADIVVIGEGEVTVLDLFHELEEDGRMVTTPGTCYKTVGGDVIWNDKRHPILDINKLPLPAYDLFDTETYAKNPVGSSINKEKWIHKDSSNAFVEIPTKSMNITPTRGCPFSCEFCYHDFQGAKYRYRNADNIIDEMQHLNRNYGVDFFLMGSDCFVINRSNVLDFCKKVLLFYYQWECSARVDTVDEELLNRMKDTGCTMVCYGIESGSQVMLDRLNKKVSVEKAKEVVKMTKKIFGQVDITFIVGTPGETKDTIQDSIDFCKECEVTPQAIFYLTPYPATPLWKWMKKGGWFRTLEKEEEFVLERLSDNEQGKNLIVNFTAMTTEELVREKNRFAVETGAWNK